MKVLGIIPARGGSKTVPRKNIKDLAGKPLIAWTIEAAKASNLTRTILTTDDEEIANVGRQFGVDVPFMRPAELATDLANAVPVMQHALRECEKTDGEYDAIMMLQPTAPMRTTGDINKALEMLMNDKSIDAVISLTRAAEYPERMKYLDEDGNIVDPPFCEAYENQPRQELRQVYEKNGAIYLTRRDVILNRNSFKGSKCKALLVTEQRSVNIDTPFQFMIAEMLMKNFDWKNW
jgi:CMP-N,N'-diacetyllegionaminic acid synthase